MYPKRTADFERLLKPQTPRYISTFSQMTLSLSGSTLQWLSLCFGLTAIGLILSFGASELSLPNYEDTAWTTGKGQLLEVSRESRRLSKNEIYAYHFQYEIEGQNKLGINYGDKELAGPFPRPISVKYLAPKGWAVMEGGRIKLYSRRLGWFILLGLAAPGLFAWLAWNQIRENRRIVRLYRFGKFTRAKLERKEMLGTRGAQRRLFRYEFAFKDEDGQEHLADCVTAKTDVLEDEANEIIFFEPKNPSNHLIFDQAPAYLEILPTGEFKQASLWTLLYWILPLASFLGVVYTILRLF